MPGEGIAVADRQTRHRWAFQTRFRRHAFGWRSQPAVERVRQAVAEIKGVARKDPVLGAEGAVLFLERVSPALEHERADGAERRGWHGPSHFASSLGLPGFYTLSPCPVSGGNHVVGLPGAPGIARARPR